MIREGRVFAYGDREAIINNADVRRYYIGERFDVGHLLDKRHRHELPATTARPAGTTDVVIDQVDDGHRPRPDRRRPDPRLSRAVRFMDDRV